MQLSKIVSYYKDVIEFVKSHWLIFLKLIVGFGLVFYLIRKISLKEIVNSLKLIDELIFSMVILLSLVNLYLQFLRWKYLINVENTTISDSKILKSLLIGFSGGAFTPARVGEYFLRKMVLEDIKLSTVITLTFIDKMMMLINVSFWGALVSYGMMLFYYHVDVLIVASLFVLFTLFFTSFFVLIYSSRFYDYLKGIKNRFNIRIPFLRRLLEPLAYLDNKLISKLLFIAFLNFLVVILEFSLIVFSHDTNFSIHLLLTASVMIMFTKTLIPSITLGEIGIRESAAIYFFGLFGCADAIAFNSSLILFILNILIPGIIGLYFLLTIKRA